MARTQIRLTAHQARRLKQLATAQGPSMAALIRGSVDTLLERSEAVDDDARRARALTVVGRFRSGTRDLAAAHDRHLADALGQR